MRRGVHLAAVEKVDAKTVFGHVLHTGQLVQAIFRLFLCRTDWMRFENFSRDFSVIVISSVTCRLASPRTIQTTNIPLKKCSRFEANLADD